MNKEQPTTKSETAGYVAAMTAEMRTMVRAQRLDLLDYLLSMVELEARNLAKEDALAPVRIETVG
jgi:hypothetical protein